MSTLTEIKTAVDSLPDEQRIELDAYIWASLRKTPVAFSDMLDERMRDMDAGKKVRWADIRDEVLQREALPE
jgi:hypothetical protein